MVSREALGLGRPRELRCESGTSVVNEGFRVLWQWTDVPQAERLGSEKTKERGARSGQQEVGGVRKRMCDDPPKFGVGN